MSNIAKGNHRRIVVKVGTSLLTGGTDELDLDMVGNVVAQIASLTISGTQIILVSSGAVAAGRGVLRGFRDHASTDALPGRQVLAAVGQGRLIHVYEEEFASHGLPSAQALLSRRDVNDRLGYLNLRNTLSSLMDNGVIPIVNENDVVAVDELEGEVFGDNDNLSALIANLVDADLLIILGTVAGMYTKDPNLYGDAEIIPVVDRLDENITSLAGPSSDKMGRGGMVTKIEAARLATASGVDVVIASGLDGDAITRLVAGESLGTLFKATVSKLESRKRWMLSGLRDVAGTKNSIEVDGGAVNAMTSGNTSLLPAGIVECRGTFVRGDIVSVKGSDGSVIAAGISNYDSDDVKKLSGVRSSRIETILGYHFGDEVIHKDNLVLLND